MDWLAELIGKFERVRMGETQNWRRGRDSNPRYGFTPHNGLANRRLRPLGHLSKPLMAAGYSPLCLALNRCACAGYCADTLGVLLLVRCQELQIYFSRSQRRMSQVLLEVVNAPSSAQVVNGIPMTQIVKTETNFRHSRSGAVFVYPLAQSNESV